MGSIRKNVWNACWVDTYFGCIYCVLRTERLVELCDVGYDECVHLVISFIQPKIQKLPTVY
jgi:hypothetical protein